MIKFVPGTCHFCCAVAVVLLLLRDGGVLLLGYCIHKVHTEWWDAPVCESNACRGSARPMAMRQESLPKASKTLLVALASWFINQSILLQLVLHMQAPVLPCVPTNCM
jgi:hypothetical protein